MVDATEAMESQYLTADLVKNSPSKRLTVLQGGKYEETEWGNRLTIQVEIDHKAKDWRPNRDSVSNLAQAFGTETTAWVGKQATLQCIKIQGKDSIIATPVVVNQETVE